MPRLSRLARLLALAAPALALAACRGDDAGDAGETTAASTDTGGTATAADTDTDTEGPVGEGLRAHLDFTLLAPDALDPAPLLGMAGAYHRVGLATDDVYALQALQLSLPRPPAAPDTIEEHPPTPYPWGLAADWVSAGTAIKLVHPDVGDALACRRLADDAYPVYLAEAAAGAPPECAPDPARWLPDADYQLVLYGGDAFEDRVITGRVSTPPALVVTAPDLLVYDLAVDTAADLAFTWEPGDPDAGDRIVIQIWDQYDQLVSVHAADDGAFTVPAARLAALSGGLGFVTVARERVRDVPFVGGAVRVITRYQAWGYIDLVE